VFAYDVIIGASVVHYAKIAKFTRCDKVPIT